MNEPDLEATVHHMEACRSLLKVSSDEVLYVAIEQLQQRCEKLERECEDLTVSGMAACGSLMRENERLESENKDLRQQLFDKELELQNAIAEGERK